MKISCEFTKKNERLETAVILLCLTVIAALVRSPGLGKWCLNTDEYYFASSVSFIVKKLVPEFPSGGYYTRGILLQYLTAIPVLLFDNFEFAVRLIPLICGILSIPVFYLICKNHLSTLPAILCTSMLLFSSWHIEFSRFARMYGPFQFMFLLFIYFFYSGYWKENRKHQFVSWGLGFLLIFFHAASIFIPIIIVLALLKQKSPFSRIGIELIIVIAILLAFNLVINKFDWLNYLLHGANYKDWIVKNRFPPGISPPTKGFGSIVLPRLDLFLIAWDSIYSTVVYILLALFGMFILYKQGGIKKEFWAVVITLLAVFLPLVHQFGILACLLFFFFLSQDKSLYFLEKNKRCYIAYVCVAFVFWVTLGFISKDTWLHGVGLFGLFENIVSNTLHYPRVKEAIFAPYALFIPKWSVFALFAIFVAVIHQILKRQSSRMNFPLLITLLCIVIVPIFRTTYTTTRYSFFFFPMVLLVICVAADVILNELREKKINRNLIRFLVFVPFIIFSFTEEFNMQHILNVSSKESNFRMGEYASLADHWFQRDDYRGCAIFVNSVFKDGDVVIANHAVTRYLKKPYVSLFNIDGYEFWNISRKGGKEEAWTGHPLIYNFDQIVGLVPTDPKKELWLVSTGFMQRMFKGASTTPSSLAKDNNLHVENSFKGICGHIEIWKFSRTS